MSVDPVFQVARWILGMSDAQLRQLRQYLEDDGRAGVTAAIPPNLPLKEDGAELDFKDWPAEYFESME